MDLRTDKPPTPERIVQPRSGWHMLFYNLVLLAAGLGGVIASIAAAVRLDSGAMLLGLVPSVPMLVLAIILLGGHFTLQPNEARVLILFGDYKGTVRQSGFHWVNPFYTNVLAQLAPAPGSMAAAPDAIKKASAKMSLRARNFNSERLKVNDRRGNPIEIATVVVWRVEDTARAAFDVDDYESYVHIQSETALRHIASLYGYDHGEEQEVTLRDGADEVALALQQELQQRLGKAGVVVDEARLTHLAYAPEIAQAMLRRQQAEAVIAARQKIVQGAVSMVEMALRELEAKDVVRLDEERKASMVSNLLVVLCSEAEVTPVVNTGTLYG